MEMSKISELKKQALGLKETDFPPQIMLEAVNWCNLNCIMCPSNALTRKRGIVEMDLVRKALDEVAIENPTSKIWPAVMGEPLLAGERLFEILAYAQEKKLPVHLNTNAVLLTNYSIDRFKELGVKEVIVGLDAVTEETFDKIRRNGDFNRVCSNVKKMIQRYKDGSPKVILQYIQMKENEHETEDFKKYWLDQGGIVKIRSKQGWGDLIESKDLDIEERIMPCPWLCRNFLILWNGEVCQCDGDVDNKYSCGNVYHQTIREIWQGEMRRRRSRHFKGDFDFEPCKNCRDWQVGLSKFYYPDDPDKAYAVEER